MCDTPGALTKNIVAMKEHLEGDLGKESSEGGVILPAISEAQRRKEREMISKEVGGVGWLARGIREGGKDGGWSL